MNDLIGIQSVMQSASDKLVNATGNFDVSFTWVFALKYKTANH